MWCLGRFLPLIVGDLVPNEGLYWDNYIMLLDIVDEIFAPVTSSDRADYVGMIVEDFLDGFKKLYPSRPRTPKIHFMVHMSSLMKKFALWSVTCQWIQRQGFVQCTGFCMVVYCMYLWSKSEEGYPRASLALSDILKWITTVFVNSSQVWPTQPFVVHALQGQTHLF